MNFREWHGPVPLAPELGDFERALQLLMNLQLGNPVRRLNWTMTINPANGAAACTESKTSPSRARRL